MTAESERLAEASKHYSTWLGLNARLHEFCVRSFAPYFRSGSALELGSADGHMTELLVPCFADIAVVDGVAAYLDEIRKRLPEVTVFASLFEEFEPGRTYDNVFAAHILEHVEDPVVILRRAARWLAPSGRIFVAVPNALSLHRLVGVKMGLLASATDLNDGDRRIGHRRVYTPETLAADVRASGLRIIAEGGVLLKPLSNGQIEAQWPPQLIEGFFELGKEFPRHTAEIFVVCER